MTINSWPQLDSALNNLQVEAFVEGIKTAQKEIEAVSFHWNFHPNYSLVVNVLNKINDKLDVYISNSRITNGAK